MDSFDITDSAFYLGNSTSNDVINNGINEVINCSNDIKNVSNDVIKEIISNSSNLIPDVISESIPEVCPDVVTDGIKEIFNDRLVIEEDNSIFIYVVIGVLIILTGVFVYNYYNKNKHVRFNEVPDVCYDDKSTFCRRSEF